MSGRIVLISSAATAATRAAAFPRDEPLDPAGAAAVPPVSFPRADLVLCSPALRCVQTAAALGLTAESDELLRDADPGRWAGRTLDDLAAAEPEAVAAWLAGAAPPGGESAAAVRERASRWLAERTGYTVAVTHPAVVRALVVALLGAPAGAERRIEVAPLTRTELRGGPGRWAVRVLGAPPA